MILPSLTPTPVLTTSGLSKSYDGRIQALQDCTLSLAQGNICAVIGPSGSGKSTLLRLLAGLERPEAGSIVLHGQTVTNNTYCLAPSQRGVGMVFQDYALFPHLTVSANVAYGLKGKTNNPKVQQMLALVGLSDHAYKYPHELSGGQQQRVALARTLAPEPKLLLLDEPFSNLDTSLKDALRQKLHLIVKQLGLSAIFITHDVYDALEIADELVFLEDGRVVTKCRTEELMKNNNSSSVNASLEQLQRMAKRILSLEKT
ncbi:MAG: ABC transporter ATP-binding protein [Bacteroidota bacterium]